MEINIFHHKFKFIFLIVIIIKSFYKGKGNDYIERLIFENNSKNNSLYNINDILFEKVYKNNSILLIEFFHYHYECIPGYAKYFIDLGYNVDVIMNINGTSSFCLFCPFKKIRIFIYKDINIFNETSNNFSFIFNRYNYILVQTTEPRIFGLYAKLNLLNINNSIFVLHHIDYAYSFPFKTSLKIYQI